MLLKFNFLLWLKAQLISVYKQEHRTTSLLESFNARLSMITPAKFNFFKILSRLETEITNTSQKLLNFVQGPGAPSKKRSKKKQFNFENIEFCTEQFEHGKMDVAKFLKYIVQDNRTVSRNSALETNNNTYGEDETSDDECNSCEQAAIEKLYCYICRIEISNILFLPCRQVIVCNKCFHEKLTDIYQCPDCKSRIIQIIEIAPRS